jgi:hypothetical protein
MLGLRLLALAIISRACLLFDLLLHAVSSPHRAE